VQAARRPPGGPWSSPQDLSAAGQAAASSQVAIDQGGDVIAVWERSDGSHYIVQAARRTAVGNWRAPEDLSTAGKDADFPQVAFDAAGNAVTVWSRSNGMNLIVQASALDASGPVFGGLTIPASGTAGMPLSFAVSPFDVWSALGPGPVWSFGDGAMGAGNSVAHAYAAAGTYKVTLSQADSLGNLSSVSRNISIAAAPPPPPPPPPPPVKHCVVPKVVGKKLIRAKVAIKRAHCRTGKVTRRYAKNKRGLVIAQKPKARRHLRVGAKVNLVVSKGRRRR